MAKVLKLDEGIRFPMGKGETRKIVYPEMGAKQLTFNYAVFGPGDEFPQHTHDESEDVILILEGSGWLKQGDKMTPIQVGDVVFVPAGEQHGTVAGENGMVGVSCQAPPDAKLYTGERDSSRQDC